MRSDLSRLEGYRANGEPGTRLGWWKLPGPLGMSLFVVCSDGSDWPAAGLPGEAWEHVSVSTNTRTPTWREMEWVRDLFFTDDELVLQYSVPRAKHINKHEFVLHMWRPTVTEIPLPPPACV